MKKPEVIIVHETVAHSIAKDIVSVCCLSAAVWLGVHLQSPALQWVAGILWMISVIGSSLRHVNGTAMTIAKARTRLNEIEGTPSHPTEGNDE
jgi:hypothetical protein